MATTAAVQPSSQLDTLRHAFQYTQDYDAYGDNVGLIASGPTGIFMERISRLEEVGALHTAQAWRVGKGQYNAVAYNVIRAFAELGYASRFIEYFALSPEDVELALNEDLELPHATAEERKMLPVGSLEEIDKAVRDSLIRIASYAFTWGRTGSIEAIADFEPVTEKA